MFSFWRKRKSARESQTSAAPSSEAGPRALESASSSFLGSDDASSSSPGEPHSSQDNLLSALSDAGTGGIEGLETSPSANTPSPRYSPSGGRTQTADLENSGAQTPTGTGDGDSKSYGSEESPSTRRSSNAQRQEDSSGRSKNSGSSSSSTHSSHSQSEDENGAEINQQPRLTQHAHFSDRPPGNQLRFASRQDPKLLETPLSSGSNSVHRPSPYTTESSASPSPPPQQPSEERPISALLTEQGERLELERLDPVSSDINEAHILPRRTRNQNQRLPQEIQRYRDEFPNRQMERRQRRDQSRANRRRRAPAAPAVRGGRGGGGGGRGGTAGRRRGRGGARGTTRGGRVRKR